MKKHLLKTSVAASVLVLAGCVQTSGTLYNEGAFGQASAQNHLSQAAYLSGALLQELGDRFRAETPHMINFAFNSAVLDDEARSILDRQADWINRFQMVHLKVYGHTDLVGSNAYNQSLGLRRARAAVNYLVSNGVSRSRLDAVVSFGESRPLVQTADRERLNRRTVTEVVGFARGYVGDDFDGKRAAIVYSEYVLDAGSEIVLQGGTTN